jgi:hypothetical protein
MKVDRKKSMPSDIEQLETIRANTLAQLVELRENPKPSYSLDGQQVSWNEYVRSLQETIEWCDIKLAGYQPFEFRSQGMT